MFLWKFNEIHVVYLVITVVVNKCYEFFSYAKTSPILSKAFAKPGTMGPAGNVDPVVPFKTHTCPNHFISSKLHHHGSDGSETIYCRLSTLPV